MVLAPDPERALQAARRGFERSFDISPRKRQRLRHGFEGVLHLEDGRPRLIDDPRAARGAPGLGPRRRHDRKHGLAVEGNDAVREDRVIARPDGADVVFTRNVGRRQHPGHARRAQDFREVQLRYAGMGGRREPEAGMQHPGRLNRVVGIGGEARHMPGGGIVPVRAVHEFTACGAGHGDIVPDRSR